LAIDPEACFWPKGSLARQIRSKDSVFSPVSSLSTPAPDLAQLCGSQTPATKSTQLVAASL